MAERVLRVLTHFPAERIATLCEDVPGVEFIHVPGEGDIPDDLTGDVLLTWAWGAPNVAQLALRGVRWIHTIGTGVDRFPLDAVGDRVLTCARGASAEPIAEWTLASMLAHEKDLASHWLCEPPARWNTAALGSLRDKTLGLVGLGAIALEIARLAAAFGMRIRSFRRSSLPSPLPEVEIAKSLADLLCDADHVVIAASATPETTHLIDSAALAAMKPGVHLVNISRGALIDQAALRASLVDGHIGLATLDVCDPEPLPAGHWLYDHPRVHLTAHVSWAAPGAIVRILETFAANLRLYLAGEPLVGVVDLKRGY